MERPDDRLSRPLYTVAEVARFLGVPRPTLDTWVHGYVRHPRGRRPVRGEPLVTSLQGATGLTIPFVGFAEAMALAAFRATGLPLQRIRPALRHLIDEQDIPHPLADEGLRTDGAELFYDYAVRCGDRQLQLLAVAPSGQRVFHEVIDRYLTRIEYTNGRPSRIFLPTTPDPILVADPEVAFGQPVFATSGAPLTEVIARLRAGEGDNVVAADFGLRLADLRTAREASPALAA